MRFTLGHQFLFLVGLHILILNGTILLRNTIASFPDGDTIAYALWNWGISMTINSMTLDGMHLKQLTEDNDTYRYDADWFDPVGQSVSPATNFVTIPG